MKSVTALSGNYRPSLSDKIGKSTTKVQVEPPSRFKWYRDFDEFTIILPCILKLCSRKAARFVSTRPFNCKHPFTLEGGVFFLEGLQLSGINFGRPGLVDQILLPSLKVKTDSKNKKDLSPSWCYQERRQKKVIKEGRWKSSITGVQLSRTDCKLFYEGHEFKSVTEFHPFAQKTDLHEDIWTHFRRTNK